MDNPNKFRIKISWVPYSKLINGLLKKDIKLNRKILSDLAINDAPVFEDC